MENQMLTTLVALLQEQFDDMRQAGLDCWDDGRSPLEWGGKIQCGTASEFSPLGMAYAREPLPMWIKVREAFESTLKGVLHTEWIDEWYDDERSISELEIGYSWS